MRCAFKTWRGLDVCCDKLECECNFDDYGKDPENPDVECEDFQEKELV